MLTPREREVLVLLREELSNEEIAQRLGISLAGAKYHVSEILGKLGVSSREEAARWEPRERPWWPTALVPIIGLWRRVTSSTVATVAASGVVVAVAAGVALLVWGLLRTSGGGVSISAPMSSCVLPLETPANRAVAQALAPDAGGAGPVALVTLRPPLDVAPSGAPRTVVRWCDATGTAREQDLPSGEQAGGFGCFDCAVINAVQHVQDGRREVGVTYDTASLGSGSPQLAYALLRLENDAWTVVWDSFGKNGWRGSHGRAEFPNNDLGQIVVHSDSWGSGSDELSGMLHEANAGPHRYFIDTWVRQGDEYARSSADTVAAPYATLVQFLYDLSVSNDAGAAAQATDPALVRLARSLGLAVPPGNWAVTCNEGGSACGKITPIRFYEGAGPAVAISFVEQGGRWLISDIQSAPNEPFPR